MSLSNEVSAVIPAYNAANFLPRTLESVLSQTRPPSEIIVVDDGSIDDTPRVTEAFQDKIIYLRQPNAGPGSARNRGILAARGQWIALLDDDDEWLPEHLERQCVMAERTGADLIFCDLSVQSPEKSWPSWLEKTGTNPRLSAIVREGVVPNPFEHLLTIGCFIMPSTVLVRRTCLLEVGLFDYHLPGRDDYDLWLRLALRYRLAFNPGTTVVRREHGSNLSFNAFAVGASMLKLWEKIEQTKQVLEDPRRRRLVRRRKAQVLWEHGYLLLDRPDAVRSAREAFAGSFHTRPTAAAAIFWLASFLPPTHLKSLRTWRRQTPLIARLSSGIVCPPKG